ncbi:hypothetical protein K1719_002211 [Acacia pycnantha]|nr:hypothetical protein K1719_002211 [Acacia pycnantha]
MSNQTTGPSVFEIDQHTNFGREIISAVLLDSQGDYVSESEFEDMFEESYSEDDQGEGEDDNNNDDEEIEGDDGNNHLKSIENLEKVNIQGSLTCSVCLEEITPSNKEEEKEGAVRIPKPCGHVYHHNCIIKWLSNHHTCPLCRYKITS